MGNLYLRTGRFDEAIDAYRRRLKTWPNNVAAHSNSGVALFQSGAAAGGGGGAGAGDHGRPRHADAHLNMALVQMGLRTGPAPHYEATLFRPDARSAAEARAGAARIDGAMRPRHRMSDTHGEESAHRMLQRQTASNGVVYYASPLLGFRAGVPHAFSTRLGGSAASAAFDLLNLGNPNGCDVQDDDANIRENYRPPGGRRV